jgi:hydrogenase maturation protease
MDWRTIHIRPVFACAIHTFDPSGREIESGRRYDHPNHRSRYPDDDGFGPHAARVLDAFYDLPAHAGHRRWHWLDLTPYLIDADVVIFVDTVSADGKPGDLHEFRLTEILKNAPAPRLGPHDPGVREALLTVAAAGVGPTDVFLVGVVPEWIATGVNLSSTVRSAIAPVIGIIATELERYGVHPRLRPTPRQPDTWWERPVMETALRFLGSAPDPNPGTSGTLC